ncbi:MAG: hypothetical protein JWR17_2019 [Pseudomonas sp.]|uniref:hypothetical protein n=1 Tax=Pseudomonas sp. TaxID=306 RepID=UPI002617226A|nr:hypothetical protein [Pseudomonas sp.]MDB6049273.1 hypothetical protein [Pseudomonas sp.]
MNDQKQPDDDGLIHIQRLIPDQFDVVLGSHPGKQKPVRPPSSSSFGRKVIFVAALGFGAYLLAGLLHTGKPIEKLVIAPPALVEPVVAAVESVTPMEIRKPVAPALPQIVIEEPAPAPTPVQRTSTSSGFQSMVSPSYMADYKSDLQRGTTPQRKVKVDIVTVSIREWDGRNRYQAQWRIYNNHIEDDSVCFNFPNASVEHRECRKAAQVFFKEQCQEWTKRADSDRLEQSKATEQRYCGAAGSFNPAG